MKAYIALFRGINVGGKNSLPMKDLVAIMESAGCENVETYIQSGNAVCRAKHQQTKLAADIRLKIAESHGFEPHVLMLDSAQLDEAIQNNPFKTTDGKALHFFFLDARPKKPDLAGLDAVKTKSERFELRNNIFYLYAPDGFGRSKLAARVEKCLGVPVTARNWNTVRQLADMIKAQ